MNDETRTTRSSKRRLRTAVAALGLGLMSSVVPLATSQATAQIPQGELTPGAVLINDRPSLHECVELVIQLGGMHGPIISSGSLGYLDQEPPERDDGQLRDPTEIAALKDRYRELGCALIPGFPVL